LSINTSVPGILPNSVGEKLIGSVQLPFAARVPGADELLVTSGQAVAPLLSKVKFAEMLGLFPDPGIVKLRVAFPEFSSVTTCGLSGLVCPTVVGTKANPGGEETENSYTATGVWVET